MTEPSLPLPLPLPLSPRLLLPLFALAACGEAREPAQPVEAQIAQPETSAPSIFALAATQTYTLPDIPDDLAAVDDLFHQGATISLQNAPVVGAWTTAPTPAGDPPGLVYHCAAGDDGDDSWTVLLDAGLVPLGVDPAALATALPFTASASVVAPAGIYLYSPGGPAWTVDGQLGTGAASAQALAQIIGDLDMQADSPNPDSIPLTRYHKVAEVQPSVPGGVPTIAQADYVLELDTVGGLGPDEDGAPCDAASDLDARSDFSADFFFVSAPSSLAQ